MIVIVGAGMAGLTAARVLHRQGAPFLLFEREESVGGRVRTDRTAGGFRLDRGFQVLFTRYPAVRRHIDLDQLGPRAFTPGAIIMGPNGERDDIDDPIRVPKKAWQALRSSSLTLADKGRIALEAADLRLRIAEGIFTDRDMSTRAYLHDRGFSHRAIERFFAPFFGGTFLDRSLSTSSNLFRFNYKMLAEGQAVLPAFGMGAIPRQLAALLPPTSLRLGRPVERLLREGDRVAGVEAGSERIDADAVIVAAEGPAAAALTGLPLPSEGVGVTTLYFAGEAPLLSEKKIVLNAAPGGYINEVAPLSNVAPEYAPQGQHLISASVLGVRPEDDAAVEQRVRAELAGWFGATAVAGQQLLSIGRISFGQFRQPPGIFAALPPVRSGIPGLYNGGEATRASSINGAMEAGEAAALAVLEDLA